MLTSLTRGFAAIAALWALRLALEAVGSETALLLWALATGWSLLAALLLRPERTRIAALGIVLLSGLQLLLPSASTYSALTLLLWIAVCFAATADDERELALVLRVLVTAAYAFAAAWKLLPTWLDATQLAGIVGRADHLTWLRPLVGSSAGPPLAAAAFAIELWLAIGLWLRRTRVLTAALGLGFHLALVVLAATNLRSVVYLTVLNLGLVALYPAFWVELRRPTRAPRRPTSRV
jgi:hypothetical protein